jgi:hypothetical protein
VRARAIAYPGIVVRAYAIALVAAAGCGRYGFSTDASAGDAMMDSSPRDAPVTPIAYVQRAGSQCGSVITCQVAFPTRSLVGDVILVTATYGVSTTHVASISDTSGNTYQLVIGPADWKVSNYRSELWYAVAVDAVAPTAATVNFNITTPFAILTITEYSGVDPSSPIDQSAFATNNNTGTIVSSGLRMTSRANELIFGHGEGQGPMVLPGAGFTTRDSSNGNVEEDRNVTAVGSYDAVFDLNQNGEWIAYMVTLR